MTKHQTDKIQFLPLTIKNLFPLRDPIQAGARKDYIVNEAYRRLFEEILPGYHDGEVPFILVEVLELDREESRPRILVYCDRDGEGVEEMITDYIDLIDSLDKDKKWSISKTDAFYTSSRVLCAETRSEGYQPQELNKKSWSIPGTGNLPRGYEFLDEVNEQTEEQEIEEAFHRYVKGLYDLYLKSYPFGYVMLIPIFLSSIYGKPESRKKLGAVFLHFATTKPIDRSEEDRALLRIYGRTLLFWHYYFTSEAVDRRQEELDQTNQEKESLRLSVDFYKSIERHIVDIREGLRKIQKPLRSLETEMNPVRGFFSDVDMKRFFSPSPGKKEKVGGGLGLVTPKHDWTGEEDAENAKAYQDLIAAILFNVLSLDLKTREDDFWAQVVADLENKSKLISHPLVTALLKNIPHLREQSPTPVQVKQTFKIIKTWFSDSYKPGRGLPVSMLKFALDVWGCSINGNLREDETPIFYVASKRPVDTLDAIGILDHKYQLKEASISASKSAAITHPGSNRLMISTCEMDIALGRSHAEGSLYKLNEELSNSVKEREEPLGDMSQFLWHLSGHRLLDLNGTTFSWKEGHCELSIDFADLNSQTNNMKIIWKGDTRFAGK